ncbi:hypothetical protein BMS3Abin17_00074 [archaeon BMS3Abin17]|nr:hypothetical protein BMS3Abin17_00074 [archaeon BMS3Abin17]
MKNKKTCQKCRKIIIEDWEKWLNLNKDEKYIECCYCGNVEVIK